MGNEISTNLSKSFGSDSDTSIIDEDDDEVFEKKDSKKPSLFTNFRSRLSSKETIDNLKVILKKYYENYNNKIFI